jgi:hypothetical protein
VSNGIHGRPLWSRALAEHRRLVYPLIVLLALDIVVFAVVVYPLSQQVANVEERNQAAERELVGARSRAHAGRGHARRQRSRNPGAGHLLRHGAAQRTSPAPGG